MPDRGLTLQPKRGYNAVVARVLRFLFLESIRVLSRMFYSYRTEWVGEKPAKPFENVRVAALLNHTSLFEALLSGGVPQSFVWDLSGRGLLPGADTTMDRPIVGLFFKWMVPHWVSITRRRDSTWERFMSLIGGDTMVLLFPEGRMRRKGGLDKHGRPMTVRAGIADILSRVDDGDMLIVYSEGLHHIHAPGDSFPRLFEQVRCRFEQIPVKRYKDLMRFGDPHFARNVMHDLEQRRDRWCRWDDKSAARGAPSEAPLHFPRHQA